MDYWICECGKKVSENSVVCPYCRKGKPGVAITAVPGPGGVGRVVVTDFDMPFSSMMVFILKWALASIPAMILLGVLFGVLGAIIKILLK